MTIHEVLPTIGVSRQSLVQIPTIVDREKGGVMDELTTMEGLHTTAEQASNGTPGQPNLRDPEYGRDPKPPMKEVVVSESMPLFSDSETGEFRSHWSTIQTGFVDEPRRAVEDADKLVAAVLQRLAEGFANDRLGLEKQWVRDDNVSTEDLRVALQRYRSFFDRLLKL
jgi:hypothetical protein